MKVLANYHVGVGCSYHRVYLPASLFQLYATTAVWSSPETPPDDMLKDLDIFWFNRVPTCSLDALLRKRDEFGFKMVTDVDDHWILYPHHEMAAAWAKSAAHEAIQKCIAIADAVLVTNDRLRNAVKTLNPKVYVVKNGLPFGHEQFSTTRTIHGRVNFMYTGGTSHYHDLRTIQPVFRRLGQESTFRAKGEVVLAGYEREFGTAKVNGVWDRMLKLITPAKNYSVFPMRPVESYMDCYRYADVALAPLEGNSFNAHKSNLKMLEAGCKNIPLIASDVEPYNLDSTSGMALCNSTQEWVDAIKQLMLDPILRSRMGRLLGDYVRTYYGLGTMNEKRYRIFSTLI